MLLSLTLGLFFLAVVIFLMVESQKKHVQEMNKFKAAAEQAPTNPDLPVMMESTNSVQTLKLICLSLLCLYLTWNILFAIPQFNKMLSKFSFKTQE